MRLYVSVREMEALARGEVLPNVASKAQAQLKPPDPIPGQLNIIDALEGNGPCLPQVPRR